MIIRKERNILVAYENDIKVGGFNISDGTWIGKSGLPVKGKPRCFIFDKLNRAIFSEEDDLTKLYARCVSFYCANFIGDYANRYTPERGQRFEALLSVGLYPDAVSHLDSDTRLTKEIVEYIKKHWRGRYNSSAFMLYEREKAFSSLMNDPEIPEWAKSMVKNNNVFGELPASYVVSAIKRCLNEKVYEFCQDMISSYSAEDYVARAIYRYYQAANVLFGSVKVEKNFLTHLGELLSLQRKYEDEHYDEVLKRMNDKPALHYENEEFIIRPLVSREDFHDEGEQQHNCVERLYMETVKNGRTHVVSVRRKDNPNKALITCEVNNSGAIRQWLTFANMTPGAMYSTLRKNYEAHLTENWYK